LTGNPTVAYFLVVSDDALVFAALADTTRRHLLDRLHACNGQTLVELCASLDMTRQAVSKHLKVLERAGLITRGREAQRRPCRLAPGPLAEVADWVGHYRRFWDGSFDRLAEHLHDLQEGRDG
jgi:DNA-binding transcriptional ArsR family regulator